MDLGGHPPKALPHGFVATGEGAGRRVAAINGQLLTVKLDDLAMVFETKSTRYWMCKQCPASALMPFLHKLVPTH
jgi:hypothetical protein